MRSVLGLGRLRAVFFFGAAYIRFRWRPSEIRKLSGN
ncbi:DNA primase [Pseudomonas phage FIM]|nr:DNA primase [Pseudomonas phage FIM]